MVDVVGWLSRKVMSIRELVLERRKVFFIEKGGKVKLLIYVL